MNSHQWTGWETHTVGLPKCEHKLTCRKYTRPGWHVTELPERERKNHNTVKPVLSGHLKIDKTKVLMENGSLMKVESIAE